MPTIFVSIVEAADRTIAKGYMPTASTRIPLCRGRFSVCQWLRELGIQPVSVVIRIEASFAIQLKLKTSALKIRVYNLEAHLDEELMKIHTS
jgi:hypothetical protein